MNNKHNDFDLLMLHLDEYDEDSKDALLSQSNSSQELKDLEKDMNTIENALSISEIDTDYGQELWSQISDQLETQEQKKFSWFGNFVQALSFHKTQVFTAFGVVLVCALFFQFGYHYKTEIQNPPIYQSQLFSKNMQRYLNQTEIFLTQVSNQSNYESQLMNNTANQLLSMNRIYRVALKDSQDLRINNLLSELEQVLTELSNKNPKQKQQHLYQYTNDQLLYKVKTFNKQLTQDNQTI